MAHVPSIAIVGGGIAGLTLALQLLKLSRPTASSPPRFTVTVYESAPAFGEIGAGVSFGPNAIHAMRCIGPEVYAAFERTETANQSPDKRDVWFDFRLGEGVGEGGGEGEGEGGDGEDRTEGELVATVRCRGGQSGVKRSDFLDELIRHLPDGVARFGKRATHYTEDEDEDDADADDAGAGAGAGAGAVTLHFRDGSAARHDAVVGCDGIKSSIRRTLLRPTARPEAADAVFSGKYCYRGLIPMDEAVAALGEDMAKNAQMYLGRHGHILTFAVEKGKVMNVVAFSSAEAWTDPNWVVAADHDAMKSRFAGWSTAARRIVGLMRRNDIWALFDHPPAPTYVSAAGRVCVAGDAAHATTPHKGAGAGMAIEDAYVLGHLVAAALSGAGGDDDAVGRAIPAAFRAYDAARRPRTQRLVEDSRETGRLYDLEHPDFGADRDRLRETLLTRMDWVWGHDVREELRGAEEELRRLLARHPGAAGESVGADA